LKKYKEKSLKENLNKKFVAFIPLRGGSKSIHLKNIKIFCGKPLAYWVIKAADECETIDTVYVATDDERIKKVVESFSFSKVIVIERGHDTATDEASTESALIEFAYKYEFDEIILIQATSPLLEKEDLQGGIDKYIATKADSMVSVVRQKRFLWEQGDVYATPINYDPQKRPRRQEWDGYFVENGAFYITSREKLLSSNCRVSGNIALYEMNDATYFEIDEESDWIIAEQLKRNRCKESMGQNIDFKRINLLICDVDGVLTDAGMYYSRNGDELKKFNTRDGKGIELLKQEGIQVMLLTSENIELVKRRAEKLNIDYVFMGVENKKTFLDNFFRNNKSYSFSRSAYIGDDVNDLECIKASLFSAVPGDGIASLKSVAKYICFLNGGQGCVREVCDLIINRRKHA